MPSIKFRDRIYNLDNSETVLEGLTRQGVTIPTSCGSGICQTCAMVAENGNPPASSQQGLKSHLQESGYFLSCICRPDEDLEVSLPDELVHPKIACNVVENSWISTSVIRLVLETQDEFEFLPGQFINVFGEDDVSRCYSIATTPAEMPHISLHIRVLPDGQVSPWLSKREIGSTLHISGPLGECYYRESEPEKPLLLLSSGTGLAPQWAVINQALAQKHSGPIYLFHAGTDLQSLYLVDELYKLSQQHENVFYFPCIEEGEMPPGFHQGWATDIAAKLLPDLKGWRVYICGNAQMVHKFKRQAFLAGANLPDIHTDPFENKN